MDPNSSVESLQPSLAVINRIANSEDVDPLELPPLYEAIDPDALDALVESKIRSEHPLTIEFTYTGYEVVVTGEGVIHIEKARPPRTAV